MVHGEDMTGEVGRSEDIVSIERAELPVEELQAALVGLP